MYGIVLPTRKHQPLTVILIVILIVIFLIINILIQTGHQAFVSTRFVNIAGVATPGFLIANISHLNPWHLLANLSAFFMLGTMAETLLSRKSYCLLLLTSALATSSVVWVFSSGITLGFSGVNMGLLAWYFFAHARHNSWENQQFLSMLIINIAIGLIPGISFAGHLGGALGGTARRWFHKQSRRLF
ncbi:MAG: rhomboid family intramembrane serine protease [Candidatus Absconditabacterales bacterium]|nr:rhomboid family intramembrane serine protease [Candidatus Absconditabacterales bacterium]